MTGQPVPIRGQLASSLPGPRGRGGLACHDVVARPAAAKGTKVSGTLAEDPFGGRQPTSRERMTGEPGYVASLASVTGPGGTLYVLCFSDDGPGTGPNPVSQAELRAAFAPGTGWDVTAVVPDRVRTNFHGDDGAPAWLATIKRI